LIEPGEGAIEYARSLVTGLSRDEAAAVLRDILRQPPGKPYTSCYPILATKTRKSAILGEI
jgi:hypothetical protein